MKKLRGRGSCPAKPIAVTNEHTGSLNERSASTVTTVDENGIGVHVKFYDLTASHSFSDFKLAKEDETTPLCDLFDRSTHLPELPFAIGAYPEWNRSRPYLTGQHVWKNPTPLPPARPVEASELMDDLLYVFMGFGGQFLHPVFTKHRDHHQELRFEWNAILDGSSQALLQRMLPLCEAVFVVQRFVEMRSGIEYGTVCHAVAAAMRGILDDWMLLVTQLESQLRSNKLTLQTLWFYVQPAMAVMIILAEICRQTAAQELQGTELLNLLHGKMQQMSGSQNAQALLQKLLEAGSVPYFEMLEKWLCDGAIQDPYSEFMIEEDPTIETTMTTPNLQSAYWQQRYQIRKTYLSVDDDIVAVHCVPSFLKQHANLILTSGKYLNAIRECGRHVERPFALNEHLVFDISCSYLRLIQKAHRIASQAFLDLFMKDMKLIEWLRSLKHFFLMDKGDMIGHLMDIAEEELEKVASQVAVNRMQSLLELAVKTSSLPAEINTEPLQVELDHRSFVDLSVCLRQPQTAVRASIRSSRQSIGFSVRSGESAGSQRASYLAEEITGWDIFMILYRIEWPMMLIIPTKLLQMYQLVFKQLFTLKRTEFELSKAWKALQCTRNIADKCNLPLFLIENAVLRVFRKHDGLLRVAQATCYQMQHTVRQYLRHVTVHTVEPRWLAMEAALFRAKDVDGVIDIHQSFIEKVIQCLPRFYQVVKMKCLSVRCSIRVY